MKLLDDNLIQMMQMLDPEHPIIWLYELRYGDADVIYCASNTEDVQFGGETYQKAPVTSGGITISPEGVDDDITVVVSNIGKQLGSFVHENDGFVDDGKITILLATLGKTDDRAAVYLDVEMPIESTEVDDELVTFKLGVLQDSRYAISPFIFSRTNCGRDYGGIGCGFPWQSLTDQQILAAGLSPEKVRRCSFLRKGDNGCEEHGRYAVALGIAPQWPRNMLTFREMEQET